MSRNEYINVFINVVIVDNYTFSCENILYYFIYNIMYHLFIQHPPYWVPTVGVLVGDKYINIYFLLFLLHSFYDYILLINAE